MWGQDLASPSSSAVSAAGQVPQLRAPDFSTGPLGTGWRSDLCSGRNLSVQLPPAHSQLWDRPLGLLPACPETLCWGRDRPPWLHAGSRTGFRGCRLEPTAFLSGLMGARCGAVALREETWGDLSMAGAHVMGFVATALFPGLGVGGGVAGRSLGCQPGQWGGAVPSQE